MALEHNHIDSPFQGSPAPLHWVPAIANVLLAAGSILFLTYVAMQMRNLSVAVSDKRLVTSQAAKIKALEGQIAKTVGQTAGQGKELEELKDLVARYFDTRKAKDEALDKLDALEESLEKNLATLKKGVKGRKPKQVEAEVKRVKAEGQRQIASLKDKGEKASAEAKQLLETIKQRIRREPAVAAPTKAKKKG